MFKIPDHIKIGGITYTVIQAQDWPSNDDNDGMLDLKTNTIYIDSELSTQAKEVTFIHECLHAINTTINHEFLDSLAEQLYQVLADNEFLPF